MREPRTVRSLDSDARLTRLDPDQFPAIPFYAKALKVLLHDVQNSGGDEATFGGKAGAMDPDAESDDGDDEWADDGAEFLTDDKDLDFLSGSSPRRVHARMLILRRRYARRW